MFYVPSTSLEKTWKIYVYKPQGKPAYAVGIEGEAERNAEGKVKTFTTQHPGSRLTPRMRIDSPVTLRRKRQALVALLDWMDVNGLITATDYTTALGEVINAKEIPA